MNIQIIKELFLNEDFKAALKEYIIGNLSVYTEDREYSDGDPYRNLIIKFAGEEICCETVG